MLVKNFFGHLNTVLKHKWMVFKLCVRAGIPWRGLVHDLSKFSPTEFWESVKYYQGGKRSPIARCKEENGYSKAWLHHKGRNKHHYQYWYDYECKEHAMIIPYKYAVEMICDSIAAGIVYAGKDWTPEYELSYWNRVKGRAKIHPCIENLLDDAYKQLAENGLKNTITKANLKCLYQKHCE